MKNFTLTKAYLLWILVSVIGSIILWQSGDFMEIMEQSVDLLGAVTPESRKTGRKPRNRRHDTAFDRSRGDQPAQPIFDKDAVGRLRRVGIEAGEGQQLHEFTSATLNAGLFRSFVRGNARASSKSAR